MKKLKLALVLGLASGVVVGICITWPCIGKIRVEMGDL